MSIEDLQAALATAKAAHKADKSNKALKKAYKVAKQALAAAQEAAAAAPKKTKKKRKRDEETSEATKKPKTVEGLTAALAAAKSAHKADKSNAALKKAYKEAKAALAAAETETPATTDKVDVASLEAALATAKAAHKADKSDAALKAAYKAAKKALSDAQTAEPAAMEVETEVKAPATNALDDLKSLKKTQSTPAKPLDPNAFPPNPKVYCGNLSWDVDEDAIKEFFKPCGDLIDVHWLTDKETERFLGRGFVTFENEANATKAIETLNETDFMGRPIRLSYAKPRNGGGGGGGSKGQRFVEKPLAPRPDNCTTAFIGNVSFEIDDDKIYEFAKDCGEIKVIRWLTDRETGDFKGCGFVEFYDPAGVDEFVKLRGQSVLGRPIRIDYSAPRPRRD